MRGPRSSGIDVTDEFAAVVDPMAVTRLLPWLRRWSDRVHPRGRDRRLLDARLGVLGLPDPLLPGRARAARHRPRAAVVAARSRIGRLVDGDHAGGPLPRRGASPFRARGRAVPIARARRRRAGRGGGQHRRRSSPVFGLDMVPTNNVLNQVVVNCAIYTLLVVLDARRARSRRWFDERQTATRRLEAELARARWEATEMRLSPSSIAGELERLATLVEVDAAGAEDEVLDMADALRRRLQGRASDRRRAVARRDALRASAWCSAIAALASLASGCATARSSATPSARGAPSRRHGSTSGRRAAPRHQRAPRTRPT